MLKIYGIKNCDSVKKALDFLSENKINYDFHDYKKLGANEELLRDFIKKFTLEKVLNKKGTSWKKLDETQQKSAQNEKNAIDLMIANTSLIKRPIVIDGNIALAGFDEDEYKKSLKN